jgi:murein DD-endopeptidase MepM/ murein hydrolase activator NlpD
LASSKEFRNAIWPLCGHVSAKKKPKWPVKRKCPKKQREKNDLPLSSTFGPRRKAGEGGRYDFHRGIDIPVEKGKYVPVFAISDGYVMIAGTPEAYPDDVLVQIRHSRPGYETLECDDVGCYHSNYMHMDLSTMAAEVGKTVKKGSFLGYVDPFYRNKDGELFPHLHFEIRNGSKFEPRTRWQRDAIHPLQVLPYEEGEIPVI